MSNTDNLIRALKAAGVTITPREEPNVKAAINTYNSNLKTEILKEVDRKINVNLPQMVKKIINENK